jgi:hypothetical protein
LPEFSEDEEEDTDREDEDVVGEVAVLGVADEDAVRLLGPILLISFAEKFSEFFLIKGYRKKLSKNCTYFIWHI